MVKQKDPRVEPSKLSDEDLICEMGVAVGSYTALSLALHRNVIEPSQVAWVSEGCDEWAARIDRIEKEINRRGFSVVAREPWAPSKAGK